MIRNKIHWFINRFIKRLITPDLIKELITPDLTRYFLAIVEAEDIDLLKNSFNKLDCGAYFQQPFTIKNPQYISIGKNFFSLFNLRIEAWDEYEGIKYSPQIIIGDNVVFNSDCHIGCINRVIIGNNVMMASRIYISDHFHGNISNEDTNYPPAKRKLYTKGEVIINDNVWVGEGVCIMPGVHIGTNAIIGANSVVTKDVPDNAVVAGIPAKILKFI